MLAVFKREFLSYFKSPVGYIAFALFAFLSGFMFSSAFKVATINMTSIIIRLCSFFLVIIPIVTMGLLSEDKKRGTDVIYYTAPIPLYKVVLGKYFAAVSLFGVFYSTIIVQIIVTKLYGGVIGLSVLSATVVFFCMVFLYVAVGIFASSLSESQIISAIVSFVFILIIQLLPTIGSFLSSGIISLMGIFGKPKNTTLTSVRNAITYAFNWLDPMNRIDTTNMHIFNVVSVIYCLSFAFFFLFLTYRMLEKKRWSQA